MYEQEDKNANGRKGKGNGYGGKGKYILRKVTTAEAARLEVLGSGLLRNQMYVENED